MPKLKPDHISLTPEEDAIVTAAAMADPIDSGYLTDEEWARMLPHAFLGKDFHKRNKVAISIRLDADVLAYFKATGAGWQGRINDALKALMREDEAPALHEPDAAPFRHE